MDSKILKIILKIRNSKNLLDLHHKTSCGSTGRLNRTNAFVDADSEERLVARKVWQVVKCEAVIPRLEQIEQ